jgi:histidyl-tRNA synthetase
VPLASLNELEPITIRDSRLRMPRAIKSVKGTRDLLPPETRLWAAVEETARRVFGTYGYEEIRTPVLEETDLFVRSVGETTDIVGKEMYTFLDKKGRSLTLRPESTASVVRAFVQQGLANQPLPVKLFYIGPQFRYERPQKGRYRQFHQIGAELIGDPGPETDAELLLMLLRFLGELGFRDLLVQLNTVGDEKSRAAYREGLRSFLEPHRQQLGEDSRRRLDSNPLRILDTKSPEERELLRGAPELAEFLSEESREHFEGLRRALDRFGVAYEIEARLVRGLDYYLGAQDAIVGGGRYDGLVAELGGPELPGIGFAIGEDRLIEVLPEQFSGAVDSTEPIAVIPVGGVAAVEALELAERLRAAGLAVSAELSGRSVKSALKKADRSGARLAILIGEEELGEGLVMLRDLKAGDQFTVPRADVIARVEEIL